MENTIDYIKFTYTIPNIYTAQGHRSEEYVNSIKVVLLLNTPNANIIKDECVRRELISPLHNTIATPEEIVNKVYCYFKQHYKPIQLFVMSSVQNIGSKQTAVVKCTEAFKQINGGPATVLTYI
jgi:hypothetical protein